MRKSIFFLYGLFAYVLFLVAFLYAIGFTGNLVVPKAIDSGTAAGVGAAILINVLLLTLFAVQHSVMARPGFKRWWTRIVPDSIERSTYVLLASAILLLLFALWRPMPQTIWDVSGNPVAATAIWAVFAMGWLIVLFSTFMIGHFNLFGMQQVWQNLVGRMRGSDEFRTPMFYGVVRHPIMVGFLIAFWATPVMTAGHLLFAVVTTGYILVATQLEERDLVAHFGHVYEEYRRRVPAFVPLPRRAGAASPSKPREASTAAGAGYVHRAPVPESRAGASEG